jgi:ADP-heptose:LPS heptosyltransferase
MMHGWKSNAYKVVGVAPFAQYKEKTYPIEKMKEVVRRLYSTPQISIVLFGSENDLRQIKDWKAEMNDLFLMHGSLTSDLPFIAYLDVMISMDSANMHLASMYGVPVVSVWGGTHPYLGFMGWGQCMDNAVQIDLPCRPSSVFGNKECPNNHQCMEGIHPLMIYEKVMAQLNAGNK